MITDTDLNLLEYMVVRGEMYTEAQYNNPQYAVYISPLLFNRTLSSRTIKKGHN